MANAPGKPDLHADPEVLAFVLRVRSANSPAGRRMVVNLDDINGNETWHFTALEPAFDRIRSTVDLFERGGSSGNPH